MSCTQGPGEGGKEGLGKRGAHLTTGATLLLVSNGGLGRAFPGALPYKHQARRPSLTHRPFPFPALTRAPPASPPLPRIRHDHVRHGPVRRCGHVRHGSCTAVEGVTIYFSDFKRNIVDKLQKDFFAEPSRESKYRYMIPIRDKIFLPICIIYAGWHCCCALRWTSCRRAILRSPAVSIGH